MKLNEYQKLAAKTDGYYDLYDTAKFIPSFVYYALGLGGEAGEAVDEVKKICREGGKPTTDRIDKLRLELGDVLWYLARLASDMGLSLDEIAEANIKKLKERYNRLRKERL